MKGGSTPFMLLEYQSFNSYLKMLVAGVEQILKLLERDEETISHRCSFRI
jgi:hypothetical protein